jgi:hypothetical protein
MRMHQKLSQRMLDSSAYLTPETAAASSSLDGSGVMHVELFSPLAL